MSKAGALVAPNDWQEYSSAKTQSKLPKGYLFLY
jgi:hypothetical protein